MAPAVLLAMALLVGAGTTVVRVRAGVSSRATSGGTRSPDAGDPLGVASALELLAACLAAGMAVPEAAAATAGSAPPALASVLRRAADLLALGAAPGLAWSVPPGLPGGPVSAQIDGLLRLARQSAGSGVALADGVAELAAQSRHDASHAAAAAAERAGVLISGPLGLCFLPAFVCLGIVPVVAGLAGGVLNSSLL